MADEQTVAAAKAKESPATLPALTHLCPVTHLLKIVWLHSVKQGKVHLTEDTLSFSGAALHTQEWAGCTFGSVEKPSSRQQQWLCLSAPPPTAGWWCQGEGKDAFRQSHGPYNLLPYINWNNNKSISGAPAELHLHSSAIPDVSGLWGSTFGVDSGEQVEQLCTLLIVEQFTKEHYLPAVIPVLATSKQTPEESPASCSIVI